MNWIDEKEWWLQKLFISQRVPRGIFEEEEKTYSQVENEKLWAKIRREKQK